MRRLGVLFITAALFGCASFYALLKRDVVLQELAYVKVFTKNPFQESVVIGFTINEGGASPDFHADLKVEPNALVLHFPTARFGSVAGGFASFDESTMLVDAITVDAKSRRITITVKSYVHFTIYQGIDIIIVRMVAPKKLEL